MNYLFLKELIEAAERFEGEEKEKLTLQNFGTWLTMQQPKSGNLNFPVEAISERERKDDDESIEIRISILVTLLNRYAKIYIKKALNDSILLSVDDFSYLADLLDVESRTKMELIEKNIHEKTTGMEIIRRLLKNELIRQSDDQQDRRSKRISLTEKGREVLMQSFVKLDGVAELISGNLTEAEKNALHLLLQKLDDFHQPIYLKERKNSIAQLVDKFVRKKEKDSS